MGSAHVPRVVAPGQRDPRRDQGRRIGRWSSGIASRHDGSGHVPQQAAVRRAPRDLTTCIRCAIGRAVTGRRQAARVSRGGVARHESAGVQGLEDGPGRAAALALACSPAVRVPEMPPERRRPPGPRSPRKSSPTGFLSDPAIGPATPVTATARSTLSRPSARGHRERDLGRHGAVGRQHTLGHVHERQLDLVGIRHDAARKYPTGPGTDGDEWATRPPVHDSAVASVRPDRPAGAAATREVRPGAIVGRRHARQRRWVSCGAAGGANSHVSGMPERPSVPSDVPLRVK